LYRERIWQRLDEVSILVVPSHSLALIDCALWDLGGKAAGLPVYKLLGAQRDSLPAYVSSLTYKTLADFQHEAEDWLERGFRAIKLHVWGDADRDIELCRAIRKQVGPGIALMVDAVGSYSLDDALRVGRKLEALGRRCEIHSFGYTLTQAANLQVMGAVANCKYFEFPMPVGGYGAGMVDEIDLQPDGTVLVPTKPGLGVDVDWEKMDAMTVAR